MLKLLFIGIGGFFGAVARYLMSIAVQGLFVGSVFPWGTVSVNIFGSLLIGFGVGFIEIRPLISPEIRLLAISGFLGAFTTFSTFSHENLILLREGHTVAAIVNISLQLFFGIIAVWGGYQLAKII